MDYPEITEYDPRLQPGYYWLHVCPPPGYAPVADSVVFVLHFAPQSFRYQESGDDRCIDQKWSWRNAHLHPIKDSFFPNEREYEINWGFRLFGPVKPPQVPVEDPQKPRIKVFWLETPDGERHVHTAIPTLLEEAKSYLDEMDAPDSIFLITDRLTQEELDALPEL
jgi:hypothetical protein